MFFFWSFYTFLVTVKVVASVNSCWWTGCQKNDWAVRGCEQYNKTEQQNRPCDNGLEYYCCDPDSSSSPLVTPVTSTTQVSTGKNCWWTGCQPNNWAVKGCQQYNRSEAGTRPCKDGLEYNCCELDETTTKQPLTQPSCWWTGCQKNNWAVRGCKQYNLTDNDTRQCDDGLEYYCCPSSTTPPTGGDNIIDENQCYWSACQPLSWKTRGCPSDMKEIEKQTCPDDAGEMYNCCLKPSNISDQNATNKIYGDSFTDFVKYLLLKGKNFTVEPDNLPCQTVDVDKQFLLQVKDDGIRICDLCPYFPQKRLVNVFLNNVPVEIQYNIEFPDCFGYCAELDSCVAFSFDYVDHECYIFNNTIGEFVSEYKWTTILMTQPVGILEDWMYSRNTAISGEVLLTTQESSFPSCLVKCRSTDQCNYVSYSFSNSDCSMFSTQDSVKYIDFVYGKISAFKLETIPRGGDTSSRFIKEGDDLIPRAADKPDKAPSPCSNLKNGTHGGFYAKSCLTSGALGCDSTSGCKLCYYPEKTGTQENLSICPDSEVILIDELQSAIEKEMLDCLQKGTCVGIGYNSVTGDIRQLTLKDLASNEYSTKYFLRYPIKSEGDQSMMQIFDFISNFDILRLDLNPPDSFQELNGKSLTDCLNTFKSDTKFIRMSHSSDKCKLSTKEVKFIAKQENVLTVSRKPPLTSSVINYARTPGLILPPETSKETLFNCGDNCEEKCSTRCNQEFKEWCTHFVLRYEEKQANCIFYEILDDSEFNLTQLDRGQIFTKLSALDFTLDSLNKLSPYQSSDLYGCFHTDSEKQTQTSLSLVEKNDDTSIVLRKRRGFFDKIKNAFKKVGNFIKDAVKDTVKTIKDTAVGVVNTVKNVVKGDWKKAKESALNIPIVKDVKNVVDLGKAVVTGDWDKAKEKGLDLLQSSTLDVATSFIPVVGKGIGRGLKAIGKTVKESTKRAKDVAKKNIPKVNKNNNNKIKNDKKGDKEPSDPKRNQCPPKKQKRATAGDKRKRPCHDHDNKDDFCPVPRIENVINKSIKGCDRRAKAGTKCEYECEVGFDEPSKEVKCFKKSKDSKALWTPQPDCDKIHCGKTPRVIIPLRTPQVTTFGNPEFGKHITVYTVLFDTTRKLPVWSIALHQSNQFRSNDYTSLKALSRANAFRPFPCPELAGRQATNADYLRSGWAKGHLTPANVARWSDKARLSSNLYINAAPQDGFSNSGAWAVLEAHVECFSTDRRSLVATGVCDKSIAKAGSVDVPSCFWKMICYKDEAGHEQVVGFMSSNTHPKTPTEKENRRQEIYTPVPQYKIRQLYFGGSPWTQSASTINQGRPVQVGTDPTVWFPVNPFSCEAAINSKDEFQRWEDKLKKLSAAGKDKPTKKPKKTKRAVAGAPFTRGCGNRDKLENALSLLGFYASSESEEGETGNEGEEGQDEAGEPLVSVQNCNKRMIGYYTSWGTKAIGGRHLRRLTHVIFAFLEMSADGTVDIGSADRKNAQDVGAETAKAKKRLENLLSVAANHPHIKVMFAVGGWENSQYFSAMAGSPGMRITFIASIIKMIQKYGFHGVDIDWEYPVTGGANEGIAQDKQNYVLLMQEIRTSLDNLANEEGRKDKYLLSFAGAAGQWTLDPGFDLPGLLKYADFANIMTYDYFGAWASKWGAYTGPPSPLYFGMPPRFSGKTNADWTVKYYTCKTKLPHKLNMGVPFYGRYWKNVGAPVDGKDGMWRTAERVNGVFEGGYVPWNEIGSNYVNNGAFEKHFHEKSQTPYAWNPGSKIFLGYENAQSLKAKVDYAVKKNVGGMMIWSVELDDEDLSLLNTIYDATLCSNTNPKDIQHKCSPIDEKRWWTSEDGDDVAGLCGKSAPLYKGYYPVCDPDDPGYSCCGPAGYCGTGEKYCDCPTCKNYQKNPELILQGAIKPSVPVTWYFLNDEDGKRGRCGRKIPKISDVYPTCNPDDENAHCCSNGGYCGSTEEHCNCNGCIDFKKNPSYKFGPKKWWSVEDGADKQGKCGPKAPKINGFEAECEPNTKFSCCNLDNGYCGSGADYCDCKNCKKFT